MKTHKFLCLLGDSSYVLTLLSPRVPRDVIDSIQYVEDPYMTVLVCKCEAPIDNVVHLEDELGGTLPFIRDRHGKLYYVNELLTKTDVINMFE